MPSFILVVSDPTTGRTRQLEIKDPAARALLGLKIGDEVDASVLGLQGRIRITGGSDIAGVPMRPDIVGPGKKYVLLAGPPGYHPPSPGMRKRKLVRGNVITEDIRQVNAVLVPDREAKPKAKQPTPAQQEAPPQEARKPKRPKKATG